MTEKHMARVTDRDGNGPFEHAFETPEARDEYADALPHDFKIEKFTVDSVTGGIISGGAAIPSAAEQLAAPIVAAPVEQSVDYSGTPAT